MKPVKCKKCERTMPELVADNPNLHECNQQEKEPTMSDMKMIHQITTMQDMTGTSIVGKDRESYFLHIPDKGAVEAWRTKSPEGHTWTESGYYGGIEMHFKHDPGEEFFGSKIPSCWVTGGDCWTTGSSLAFDEVEHHFDSPSYIRALLKEWAYGRFLFDRGADDE